MLHIKKSWALWKIFSVSVAFVLAAGTNAPKLPSWSDIVICPNLSPVDQTYSNSTPSSAQLIRLSNLQQAPQTLCWAQGFLPKPNPTYSTKVLHPSATSFWNKAQTSGLIWFPGSPVMVAPRGFSRDSLLLINCILPPKSLIWSFQLKIDSAF